MKLLVTWFVFGSLLFQSRNTTPPEITFGSVRAANERMGFAAREARSQHVQDPTDVQAPKTETSITELSDLRRRAEVGDRKAQYELGRIYVAGLGVSQDYRLAAKWYGRAADGGLAAAQFIMGFLYEHG